MTLWIDDDVERGIEAYDDTTDLGVTTEQYVTAILAATLPAIRQRWLYELALDYEAATPMGRRIERVPGWLRRRADEVTL